ncbi:serine/threonine protein kinase [Microbispora sp. RL4-1S]|uniref:non-specific serine/threonine protein kinase n=1 Tax=Microbispora oryzae TaxID=2806554 RepID=A0A941ART1_9ACTN|nr:serine/threonine-protein kinase [Microbispora oryzae]MBP2706619.1 serine/threonine protein kinase [Microbispora oryzae]
MEPLAGRYRLAEPLGEGGGGTVWRAVDELLHREVAVKQVRIPDGLGPAEIAEFTGRAVHEARTAGRLSHPSIVMVHDVVDHGGRPWIVMDLVPGRSLDKVIAEDGPLPPRRVAEIGLVVLDALEAAHARGILHRDVKPANVLIGTDGRAMLTDFGIAAPLGPAGAAGPYSSAGSPAYMAPERFREEPDGPPSDLWSLGATLYTAVEGRPPFQRPMAAALVAAVLMQPPPPMARATPELAWLVLALLEKEPPRRPPAHVVRRALMAMAGPDAPSVSSTRPARRRRTGRLALAAAAVLVVGVGAGLGAWRLTSGGGGPGAFAAAPDPCQSLTDAQVRGLLGSDAEARPVASACTWTERSSGSDRTLSVRYQVSSGGAGVRTATLDFAGRRAARAAGPGLRDEQALADEAFGCDLPGSSEGTADGSTDGTTDGVGAAVWFRLSNLVVEITYRHSGAGPVTEDDRRTADRAARLVGVGLG